MGDPQMVSIPSHGHPWLGWFGVLPFLGNLIWGNSINIWEYIVLDKWWLVDDYRNCMDDDDDDDNDDAGDDDDDDCRDLNIKHMGI